MTQTIIDWLFDVYPNKTNPTIWIISKGEWRWCLAQDFTVLIYTGPLPRLLEL